MARDEILATLNDEKSTLENLLPMLEALDLLKFPTEIQQGIPKQIAHIPIRLQQIELMIKYINDHPDIL